MTHFHEVLVERVQGNKDSGCSMCEEGADVRSGSRKNQTDGVSYKEECNEVQVRRNKLFVAHMHQPVSECGMDLVVQMWGR